MQILDPFIPLFDERHTALGRFLDVQAERLDEALGGAARIRQSSVTPKAEINLERWRRRYGSVGVLMNPRPNPRLP